MIRLGLLLVLLALSFPPAHSEPVPQATRFDSGMASRVFGAALAFIAPRALEPVTVPQLAIWGLHGLTALDPELTAGLANDKLELATSQRILVALPAPGAQDTAAWAGAAAQICGVAWTVSASVQRAGTSGIISSFFMELFTHLDPYSRYVSPADAAEDAAARWGSSGVGVDLAKRGRAVIVQSLAPEGPAILAGIRAGDRILAVDGQTTAGHDPGTIATWLSGPEGSSVRLQWRNAAGVVRAANLVREMIPPETVFPQRLDTLLVLRLSGFSRSTNVSFANAIEQATSGAHAPDGVVVDLRGNRGGLLSEAVSVADELLGSGVVATTEGRDPAANRVWQSRSGELLKDIPVVVLVDGRTASAAEILAAALADRGRAVVVGTSTLGKGLVQTFTTLPDGGEVFITWSHVLAPRGWPIQGLGVLPQVCTSLGEAVLVRELSKLADGEQPMATALVRSRNTRVPVSPQEVLAIREACPAAEGRQSDLDVAQFLIENPAAYAAALLPPLGSAISQ